MFIRNAEDTRRDDELQSSSHHVLTLDGEVMAVNGKLLSGHVFAEDNEADQTSVCSCNCLGLTNYDNQHLLFESSYQPSATILAGNSNSLLCKRASV